MKMVVVVVMVVVMVMLVVMVMMTVRGDSGRRHLKDGSSLGELHAKAMNEDTDRACVEYADIQGMINDCSERTMG